MFSRIRHTLVLVLFALLPFHALFVTVGTKLIAGPGNAPIPWLAMWKEGIIGAIFVVGIIELGRRTRDKGLGIKGFIALMCRKTRIRWVGDMPTILIVSMLLIVFALTWRLGTTNYSLPTTTFVFGFKYLFIPLIFFLLLKNLSWDEDFLERRLLPILLIVGGIVALYGIITFFLPMEFFTALGYSDAHSLYSPGAPLSAFQQIGESGIRRIQSTFAGPNQFGVWLLIPLSVGLVKLVSGKNAKIFTHLRIYAFTNLFVATCIFFVFIAILLTFSRSAWIAAFMITIIATWMMLRGQKRIIAMTLLAGSSLVACLLIFIMAPNLVLRGISNRHHFERVRAGISAMMENPFGLGLGSAGPAQNRVSDACVYFDAGADISWAKNRRDLCLFVGGMQAQPLPSEKVCSCPLLPENWYVQVGIELGIAGFLLFVALVIWNIVTLLHCYIVRKRPHGSVDVLPIFLAFIGVSVAALFLHAWEDSAVAYTAWGMAGIVLAFTPP